MTAKATTQATWEQDVLQAEGPVLVDFWAAWCGPCRMVSPVVDEIAREYDGRLKVGKVDVDAEPAIAQRFGVQSIPMLVVVKGGEVVAQAIGARPKAQLVQALRLEELAEAAAA